MANWKNAGKPFFVKEGLEFEELPNCCNCEAKVPKEFPSLSKNEKSMIVYPCCSYDCVDKLFKKINGFKPHWEKIGKK